MTKYLHHGPTFNLIPLPLQTTSAPFVAPGSAILPREYLAHLGPFINLIPLPLQTASAPFVAPGSAILPHESLAHHGLTYDELISKSAKQQQQQFHVASPTKKAPQMPQAHHPLPMGAGEPVMAAGANKGRLGCMQVRRKAFCSS